MKIRAIVKKMLVLMGFLPSEEVHAVNSLHLDMVSNSILIPATKLRFDVIPEDRIYVKIGEKCVIGAEFVFESAQGFVKIGNNSHLGMVRIICRSSVLIGCDVTMAWGITIYDHDSHSTDWEKRKDDNSQCYSDRMNHGNSVLNKNWDIVPTSPIIIEDKVWIGFDALILKGVTIGEGSVVGAKSVVTKNVPAWSVVPGNRAKVVRKLQ